MDDTMQATVQNIVNSLDWSSLDFSSWKDAEQYIKDNILSLFNTTEGKQTLADIQVMLGVNFEEDGNTSSDTNTLVNNVKEKLKDEFDDKVGELTLDELQIAAEQIEVSEGTLLSWDELTAKIKEAKEASQNPVTFSDIFAFKNADDTLTTLGKISESIDTIQNAYKTLYSAIEEYNEEGAFSVDTLQSVIALGDNWLDYLVDENGALKLDKQSLEELTLARLNDMRIQAINNVWI